MSEIANYHSALTQNDQLICQQLQLLIDQSLPNAESKIWHGHPVWFMDGNPIVGYSKLKDSVRMLFWSGQSFDEPGLSVEGKFKAAEKRYTSADQINEADVARWLSKAANIQWDYKNIVKRKGQLLPLKGL